LKFRIGQIWYSPVLEDIVEIIGINDRFYLDIMFELKGNESTYDMPKSNIDYFSFELIGCVE